MGAAIVTLRAAAGHVQKSLFHDFLRSGYPGATGRPVSPGGGAGMGGGRPGYGRSVIAIGSLLVLLALSLIVTRVATLVLVATGMSHTAARFQARSAFTGAGFTTSESEQITDDPLRRKVVMNLMMLGHLGIVAGAGTVILGFDHGNAAHLGLTGAELVAGLFVLLWVSRSSWVDRHLTRLIWRFLHRFSRVARHDVETLVELPGRHAVCELAVRGGDRLEGHPVSAWRRTGVEVLGVTGADHAYDPAPAEDAPVAAGSTLVVYGPLDVIRALDRRGPDGAGRDGRGLRGRLAGHPAPV